MLRLISLAAVIPAAVGLEHPQVPGWPGYDTDLSNAAWPSGAQPTRWAAWPTELRNGSEVPTSCWSSTALEDVNSPEDAWNPGACSPAPVHYYDKSLAECESTCKSDPLCTVWYYVNNTNGQTNLSGDWGCYQAIGSVKCEHNSTVPNVIGGQRLQKGNVGVFAEMTRWWVGNLSNVGVWSQGTAAEGAEKCRKICYSDLYCQFWQYGTDGCWVESESNPVSTPLTSPGGARAPSDSAQARSVLDAEFIQHQCPEENTVMNFVEQNKLWLIIGGAALLVLLGVFSWCLCCRTTETRSKKKRGIKMTPGAESLTHEATNAEPGLPDAQFMSPSLFLPTTVPTASVAMPMAYTPMPQMAYAPQASFMR